MSSKAEIGRWLSAPAALRFCVTGHVVKDFSNPFVQDIAGGCSENVKKRKQKEKKKIIAVDHFEVEENWKNS